MEELSLQHADLVEMLNLQVSEIEMLQSMYPNPGELVLDDPLALADIQEFTEGKLPYETLLCRLGFTLKLEFSIPDGKKDILEVVCHLPHEYPSVVPNIFLRSASLPQPEHHKLSEQLQGYISSLERGEICLTAVVQWLQDNAESFLRKSEPCCKTGMQKETRASSSFTRMWIYSHHIYSKIKRKDILDFSAELSLSGFCMPGKPGIICIEGDGHDVEDFWQRIRRMQWKKLVMKEREDSTIAKDRSLDSYRKFEGFEEKYFEPRQGKGRGAHMDRGLLYQFLEKKGCGPIFQMYFGVEGRGAEDSD